MRPTVTYTVPAGWGNFEDYPGGLLLLPPGSDLDGIDAGTADYVSVSARVAAMNANCNGTPAVRVGRSATEIATALHRRGGLTTTVPTPIELGGLRGIAIELRLAKGWRHAACSEEGIPDVALLVGLPPSNFSNAVTGRTAIEIYLLDGPNGTISIEADDVSGGSHLGTMRQGDGLDGVFPAVGCWAGDLVDRERRRHQPDAANADASRGGLGRRICVAPAR